jgi:restriction system protein
VIVVPYWGGTVAIGIAGSEEFYDSKYEKQDGCNQRRVDWPTDTAGKVRLLPRGNLSEGLQTRLKIRISIADLIEFKEELDTVLESLTAGKVYSWTEETAKKQEQVIERAKVQLLKNIQSGKTSLASGGIGLERLVKELLIIDGFNAEVIGNKKTFKGYGDADIKASKLTRFRAEQFLIQVKHHKGSTSVRGQQQLLGIRELMADDYSDFHLVLVTSGEVGEEEKQHGAANDISVIDGRLLVDWIFESVPKLSTEWKLKLGLLNIPHVITP